jgi:signal transduction histidine kinase
MKLKLSLKLWIALSFLILGITIVTGYSMLSIHFFFRGMDSIISVNMENAAEDYLNGIKEGKTNPGNVDNYTVTQTWEAQTEQIKTYFKEPKRFGVLHKQRKQAEPGKRPHVMYFLIKLKVEGQTYFVSRAFTRADASPLVGQNARQSRQFIISLSMGITLLLALVTWLLMKRLSQPVSKLTKWTHELRPETLKQSPPDFAYPELNEMAELIKGSLSSVNESMEREQKFLRFTSHELRTPISVIRNNVELMHKIQQKQSSALPDKQQEIFERIARASLTMQNLCETLLWLNRDETDSLVKQHFRLDELIDNLVDELRYLLKSKPVTIQVETQACELHESSVAARIIIGNLIRNAFQHTWNGHVSIQQHGAQISIRNHSTQSDKGNSGEDQGFGLGLQLTEQLCRKLQWQYQNQVNSDGHSATLSVIPAHSAERE